MTLHFVVLRQKLVVALAYLRFTAFCWVEIIDYFHISVCPSLCNSHKRQRFVYFAPLSFILPQVTCVATWSKCEIVKLSPELRHRSHRMHFSIASSKRLHSLLWLTSPKHPSCRHLFTKTAVQPTSPRCHTSAWTIDFLGRYQQLGEAALLASAPTHMHLFQS